MSGLNPSALDNPSVRSSVGVTPVKSKLGSYPPCAPLLKREEYQAKMASDSDLHWVGPKPHTEFFTDYMPVDEPVPANLVKSNYFNQIPKGVKEHLMYGPMKKLVERAGLLGSSYVLFDTSNVRDTNCYEGTQWRPDLGCFRTDDEAATTNESGNDHVADGHNTKNATGDDEKGDDEGYDDDESDSDVHERHDPSYVSASDRKKISKGSFEKNALPFEFKPDRTTPFDDPPKACEGEARKEFPFQNNNPEGILLRGQIGAVLTEICARQHRTRTFMVFMNAEDVRFLYHDRSATVVSEAIKYRTKSGVLAEFLWRFARLTEEQQGIDKTVKTPTDAQRKAAKAALTRWMPKKERPVVILEVPTADGKTRDFVVWGAMSEPKSLTGRATRAYPAYDLEEKKVVFLKDTWRANLDGMEKESDILKELNAAGVRHVPKFQCGDDIPGDYHSTVTQNDIDAPWRAGPVANLCKRTHHRFTENFVGNHLDFFKNPKDLMRAISHAVIAHQDAYLLCSILHRDVSGNNVLMGDDAEGVLNDWDLAKRMPTRIANPERWAEMREDEKKADVQKIKKGPRHPHRTGTWYFMSNYVLRFPGKEPELLDDLESFFWVVLFFTLQYLPSNKNDTVLGDLISKVFAQCEYIRDTGLHMGGDGKYRLLSDGPESLLWTLKFEDNRPLTKWMARAHSVFQELVDFITAARKEAANRARDLDWSTDVDISQPDLAFKVPPLPSHIRLRDHQSFLDLFNEALNQPGWPNNRRETAAVFQPPSTTVQYIAEANLKRTSEGLATSAAKRLKKSSETTMSHQAGPSQRVPYEITSPPRQPSIRRSERNKKKSSISG